MQTPNSPRCGRQSSDLFETMAKLLAKPFLRRTCRCPAVPDHEQMNRIDLNRRFEEFDGAVSGGVDGHLVWQECDEVGGRHRVVD